MKKLVLVFLAAIVFQITATAQWDEISGGLTPTFWRYWSIKIADDSSVWAISTQDGQNVTMPPRVHTSADDGENWTNTELEVPGGTAISDVEPIDATTAFVSLYMANGLYKTTDGGVTWTAEKSYPHYPILIHFFNENDGWIFGGANTNESLVMSVTTDGGATWTHAGGENNEMPAGMSLPEDQVTNESIGLGYSTKSFYDVAGDVIVMGRSNGYVWRSIDKGYNWERMETPLVDLGRIASNVAVKNANTFMVASDILANGGFNGTPTQNFATTDGGENWVSGMSGVTAGATAYIPNTDSIFITAGHNNFGWGSNGVKITYDLGQTWEFVSNTRLLALDFNAAGEGVGTCCNNSWFTADGQIYKWNFELPVGIENVVDNTSISLFPNPVGEELTIQLDDVFSEQELVLQITNAAGQTVLNSRYNTNINSTISVNDLPRGMYYLQLIGAEKRYNQRFIKE